MTNQDPNESDLEIIVGTYEDYVVGYQVESIPTKIPNGTSESAKKRLKKDHTLAKECQIRTDTEQSFAVRSHTGSVRCLAGSSNGNLVFSSGHDEMINLFNLKKRKLTQTSEGAVNCATFVGSSHLICGSEDGDVYIYECKSAGLNLAKTLKGHKAAVTSIAAHPTGKVLLSISKDHTMRTWNLIKGRSAYVTQIKPESHLVVWSQTGDEFLIAANNEIYLYNNSGNLRRCIKLEKRVNDIEFITGDIFAVAIDSGKLEFFNRSLDECPSVVKLEAHETRIKSIKCLTNPEIPSNNEDDNDDKNPNKALSKKTDVQFATAASDGTIKIWSLSRLPDMRFKDPKELVKVDIGTRITCMIVSRRAVPG